MINALPYTFEEGRPGFILNKDALEKENLQYHEEWNGTFTKFNIEDLNIVDAATFVAGFENKFDGNYDNYPAPSLIFVRYRTSSEQRGIYDNGSPKFYDNRIYPDSSCIDVQLVLDMAAKANCPVADESAIRVYNIGNKTYTLYDGPDCGGYDAERKLYIHSEE